MTVTNRDVAYALRHLHRPDLLARSPLASKLRSALATSSSRDGVVVAVKNAFATVEPSAEIDLLRDIVMQNAIDDFVPRESAAINHKMSLRSFSRKYARAVKIITDYINTALADRAGCALAAFAQFRSVDDCVACAADAVSADGVDELFDIARAGFISNRTLGDTFAMEASLDALHGFQSRLHEQQLMELGIMNAELSLYLGRYSVVSDILDGVFSKLGRSGSRRLWLAALFVNAQLSFTIGSLNEAHSLACAVREASSEETEMHVTSAALLGRIAALTGSAWHSLPHEPATKWEALSLAAVESRLLLLAGHREEAFHSASAVHSQSEQCGFVPLSSWSAATLAAHGLGIDDRGCSEFAIKALRSLAATSSNAVLARDLFQFGMHVSSVPKTVWLAEDAYSDIAAVYLSLKPESVFSSTEELQSHVPHLIRAICRRIEKPGDSAAFDESVELLSACINQTTCLRGTLWSESLELADFGEFLKVLVPLEQQVAFVRSFRASAAAAMRALARSRSYSKIRACSLYAS